MEKNGFKFTVSKYDSKPIVCIEIRDADGKIFFEGEISTEHFANAVLGTAWQEIIPKYIDGKKVAL